MNKTNFNSKQQSGFSLLEAIVAIAIMAGFGMAIFGWLNTNLLTITKIENRANKNQLIRSVSEFMQDIDIMAQPNGERKIVNYVITWSSELIEPILDGRSNIDAISEFQLGLYQTEVKIIQENKTIALFDLRLVGYEKVRNFDVIF